jgi:hypothetical protein
METTIILTGKEAKQWAMMKVLDNMGAFDVKFGKISIDFDGQGRISNVKIEKNFRPELLTVAIKNEM